MKLITKLSLLLPLPFLFGFSNIAHRGDNELGRYAEHSYAAYDHAVVHHADYLELDLQQTKDHVLVVSHDDNLSRVFGVNKNIAQTNFHALRKYCNRANEPLHSLAEVFSRYQADPAIKFMIETKTEKGASGMERRLVELIKERHLEKRVLFESFSLSSLAVLAKLAPEIPRTQLGGDYHQIGRNQYFAAGFYDQHAAEFLQRHHKRYLVWGVDSKRTMHQLRQKPGLSGILTDFPNRFSHASSSNFLVPSFPIRGKAVVKQPFAIVANSYQILPENSSLQIERIRLEKGHLQYGLGKNRWVYAAEVDKTNQQAPQTKVDLLFLKKKAWLFSDPNGQNKLKRNLPAGSKWNYFAISSVSGHHFYNLGGNQWLDGRDVRSK